ncbi:MAG: lipid II flippase family protein [Chitinophagales bacterium]
MTTQFIIVLVFTFIINLISSLSYSIRWVGIRTRKVAISFSIFNIMVLLSRTSNSVQAPLLAKRIENNINLGIMEATADFRYIILAASLATLAAAFLFPTFQEIMTRGVNSFSKIKSIPKLFLNAFASNGRKAIWQACKTPRLKDFRLLLEWRAMSMKIFFYNILIIAIITVGVLASLNAGYLNPDLRITCSTLSASVNGIATILLIIFVDPYLSLLTDEVIEQKFDMLQFRTIIAFMLFSRFLGTLLAQLLLVPASYFILWIAEII